MKWLLFISSVILFSFSNVRSLALSSEPFELKTSVARLVVDMKMLTIVSNNGKTQISTPTSGLWKIDLQKGNDKTSYAAANGPVSINFRGGIIYLSVAEFTNDGSPIPVRAEFTISVKGDAFCFGGTVGSLSKEWKLKEVSYPDLTGIRLEEGPPVIYWPNGLGGYYDNPKAFGQDQLSYPSGRATMPWYSINSKHIGLYIGSHDTLQGTKRLILSYDSLGHEFSAQVSAPVFDVAYSIPDVMVKPYVGEWYAAAKFYRAWYDRHFKLVVPPDWVKDNSGWLLAILKQQNMEVMWSYKEIDKLCDIAEQYNLSTIGLFGWGYGGHDHLYPFYTPDNTMGGKHELEAAIARARIRGIHVIIYANGKIMDASTDFYKYYGSQVILRQSDLRPQIQYYIKQRNATPVIFAQACDGSDVWRRTMYNLALQAASFGADGIIFDQLGVMAPGLCFSSDHDHKPGQSDPKYRLEMVNEARREARAINPKFVVMTEAANDFVSKGIDFTHGWGLGYAPGRHSFPELFRYTFPELIETQRNPNPLITRTDANYAVVVGLRHEIESRYPADVEYLVKGKLPTKADYSDVVSPASVEKMNQRSAVEARAYVHSLIDFENENSEFFRRGKFIARDGIGLKADADIRANGFLAGEKLGVLVWNMDTSKKEHFSIEIKGFELVGAKEIGKAGVPAFSALGPDCIRLLVYRRVSAQ